MFIPNTAQWFDQGEDIDKTTAGNHELILECWGEESCSLRKYYLCISFYLPISFSYFFLIKLPITVVFMDPPLRIGWQMGCFYLDSSTLLGSQP